MPREKRVLLANAAIIAPHIVDGIYVGIDQSISGTGMVALDGEGQLLGYRLFESTQPSRPMDEIDRIVSVYSAIQQFVEEHRGEKTPCIVLEDFAYSQPNQMALLGGLGWFLRIMLAQTSWHFAVASTSIVKKAATGKGVANKSAVILGVYKRWGFETDNDNIADAYALSYLSWCHYAKPLPDRGTGVRKADLENTAKLKTYR